MESDVLSDDVKDLIINGLMSGRIDFCKRITLTKAMEHPWVTKRQKPTEENVM